MNKKQENRFSMYIATADFCEKNTDFTAPLPNFSANLANLKTTSDQIHLIAETQATDTSGTTAEKNDDNENMVVLTADTSRKLTAFAKLNKNQKLAKEISFTETDLRRLPDTILPDTAQLIYNRAQEYLPSLADYMVTEETQATLLQAITDSKQTQSSPRVAKVGQVQATKQLAELFVAGDEALANMDAVVEIVRLTQANFYAGYKSVRKIIETGNRKMSVKGLVTDGQTGEPIKGVAISFWPDGDATKTYAASEASLVKKTANKGGFYVNSMPAGTYRITLQKAGYAEQTLMVYVNNGELTTVDVKLAKV
ncbi:MAG: carboxypeptidase-like regulatory domain-containing protein [Prolixibacteraceae bacterium]|nr:carboxypeptidase-like regulatory domain-containing protein [Prolixibacteraceae bacterium]